MFVQGHILPLNLLSGAFSNILIYMGCYIFRTKALLALKLVGVLNQKEHVLMPSPAFETETLLVHSSICVTVPMDG